MAMSPVRLSLQNLCLIMLLIFFSGKCFISYSLISSFEYVIKWSSSLASANVSTSAFTYVFFFIFFLTCLCFYKLTATNSTKVNFASLLALVREYVIH